MAKTLITVGLHSIPAAAALAAGQIGATGFGLAVVLVWWCYC